MCAQVGGKKSVKARIDLMITIFDHVSTVPPHGVVSFNKHHT